VETQINDLRPVDSIESYGPDGSADDIETELATPKPREKTKKMDEQIDNGLRCECSISVRVIITCYYREELTPSRSRMHVVSVKEAVDNGITFGLFSRSIYHQIIGLIMLQVHGVYNRCGTCRKNMALTMLCRYHSDKDERIPQKFICFDCRARADVSWDLIKTSLYPQILSKFRELALFRQ
jgi:hypothetical protein